MWGFDFDFAVDGCVIVLSWSFDELWFPDCDSVMQSVALFISSSSNADILLYVLIDSETYRYFDLPFCSTGIDS